jgi:hypothetical protein
VPKATAPTAIQTAAPAAGVASTSLPAPFTISGVTIPPGAPPPRLGASHPDQLTGGGLANNFNGRVVSIWLLPRKYKTGKKANTYSGFAEITIKADDDSLGDHGLVREYYNVTALNQWVPSRVEPVWNGQTWVYTPAGGDLGLYMKLHTGEAGFPVPNGQPGETAIMPPDDWRGFFWIPGAQNADDKLRAKGTKWDQFITQLKLAGYYAKAPHVSTNDMRQFLIGVYGHWVRLDYEFTGGQAPAMEPGQNKPQTLCLAEILDLGPISGAGGPVAAGAQAVQAMQAAVSPAALQTATIQAPQQVVAAPIAAPNAQAPAPAGAVARDDPAAISAASNEILTTLVAARGVAGVLKGEAGQPLYDQLNTRGLNGARGLLLLNDIGWMEGDDRTFGYVAASGMMVPL